MTFYVDIETECEAMKKNTLDIRAIFERVAVAALDREGCPYEASINLLITDDEGIREINNDQRKLDASTDVLSFPGFQFESPGDFQELEEAFDCFEPDTGELLLGDIVISIEHVYAQAESYGHSPERELAFLIAHSMLHLIGYDHMEPGEEKLMFSRQEEILKGLGITR